MNLIKSIISRSRTTSVLGVINCNERNMIIRLCGVIYSFSSRASMVFEAGRICGLTRQLTCARYEEAVKALNKLMDYNAIVHPAHLSTEEILNSTVVYLQRSGLSLDDLDKLSVIHVSGTKGKGSTCALTESILHSFGLRTGFFSSPHLISVTERFRINGKPITQEEFSENFWRVYDKLYKKRTDDKDMPGYFKFLTILAFHIFFHFNVDVAIIEVGIGGLCDSTNITRYTKTIGITSLGYDHTAILGKTLPEIAFQKAGIIKPYSNVFTVKQPMECMEVIRKRAEEQKAKLFIAPNYEDYKFEIVPKMQIESKVQKLNASLAIQLAYDWIKHNKPEKLGQFYDKINLKGVTLDTCNEVIDGLQKCFWPGRCHIVPFDNKKFYLDGAHTVESIEACSDWFASYKRSNPKCLIFNTTGPRDSLTLIKLLRNKINFDLAIFVPNIPFSDVSKPDNNYSLSALQSQVKRCNEHSEFWRNLNKTSSYKSNSYSFTYVEEAIKFLNDRYTSSTQEVDVLVTGSIHLIGAFLLAMEDISSMPAVKQR